MLAWVPDPALPFVENAPGATNVAAYSAWLNGTLLQDGATPCGMGGVYQQLCTDGAWVDTATCVNEQTHPDPRW